MQATTALVVTSVILALCLVGCTGNTGLYKNDITLLNHYTDGFELADSTGQGRVYVVPKYQGRVMTSSFDGLDGKSMGWINPPMIKAGITPGPINTYGGEERFWIGPEGGQFSIFFKPNTPFDLAHWKVPAVIDTEPFKLVKHDTSKAVFEKDTVLTNRAGFTFHLRIDRTIKVLEPKQIEELLKLPEGQKVSMVGYQTTNVMTNTGKQPWSKKTGLLSIWLLGQYPPSAHTTVTIPIKQGDEKTLGPRVNVYESFNKLDSSRLRAEPGVVFYRGDGQYRSKIGVPPTRAESFLGSYNPDDNVLTLVWHNAPEGVTSYVKSTWEIQKHPFGGDEVNSYNDGPPAPGKKPLGPFYELETSSPAVALAPDQNVTHVSRTFHLTGPKPVLDALAKRLLGASLKQIDSALP